MSEDLDFLPFDMMGVKPKNGFDPYPVGIYLLELKSSEAKTSQNSGKMYRNYKSEIIMGPGWSQEYAGKPVSDMIMLDEENKGRHADLFQACFGGEEAYNQLVMQNQGRLSAGLLNGRRYIAQLTISKDGGRNFIGRRLPYTEENWKSNAGEMQQSGGLMQAQPVAAPQMAAPPQFQQQAPMQPQMAAPQAAPQMAPPQAPPPMQMQQPMQQFQAPPAPPAAGTPQWPAPPAQQQGAPAYPAPPPPPGAPTGGSQQ